VIVTFNSDPNGAQGTVSAIRPFGDIVRVVGAVGHGFASFAWRPGCGHCQRRTSCRLSFRLADPGDGANTFGCLMPFLFPHASGTFTLACACQLMDAGHEAPSKSDCATMNIKRDKILVAPYEASHSGLLEPRGTSTVRKAPGVRDKTTWSVNP